MAEALSYNRFLSELKNNFGQDGLTVLIVELKELNELDSVLGYTAIDHIAQQVLQRTLDGLRQQDKISLLGRNQIGIILPNLSSKNHAVLAGHKIIRMMAEPVQYKQHQLIIRPVIGIAMSDKDTESADILLCQANSAMKTALIQFRSLALYDDTNLNSSLAEHKLVSDLERAIEESDLFLALQPQFSLSNDQIISTEALLRWIHPQQGPKKTDSLIKLIEHTPLVTKLTAWVISTALRQCSEYRKAGLNAGVHINLSAHNLREPDLVDVIYQNIILWEVPAEEVIIELTETAVLSEESFASEQLNAVKCMGLKLSMDDFGTGYSSISRMVEFPFDEIKIDQSFVKRMGKSQGSDFLVESIINLSHKLNLKVIAEGVEDELTVKRLKNMGCDAAQGFFLAKPQSLNELLGTLSLPI